MAVDPPRLDFSHVAGAHAAALLARNLEAVGSAETDALAAQGRELELAFARWAVEAPGQEERAKVSAALSQWEARALAMLTKEPSR